MEVHGASLLLLVRVPGHAQYALRLSFYRGRLFNRALVLQLEVSLDRVHLADGAAFGQEIVLVPLLDRVVSLSERVVLSVLGVKHEAPSGSRLRSLE